MATKAGLRASALQQYNALKNKDVAYTSSSSFTISESGYSLAGLAVKIGSNNPHRLLTKNIPTGALNNIMMSVAQMQAIAQEVATYLDGIQMRYITALVTIDALTEAQLVNATITV
jgi:hypothetical protein